MDANEISVTDALCIIEAGWSTDLERELLNIAHEVIQKRARILHLEYQKEKINKELMEEICQKD